MVVFGVCGKHPHQARRFPKPTSDTQISGPGFVSVLFGPAKNETSGEQWALPENLWSQCQKNSSSFYKVGAVPRSLFGPVYLCSYLFKVLMYLRIFIFADVFAQLLIYLLIYLFI